MLLKLSHKKFKIDNVNMSKIHYQFILKKFVNKLRDKNLSRSYIHRTPLEIRRFYRYLYAKKIYHLSNITTEQIYEYLSTLHDCKQSTKYTIVSKLRVFFNFLYYSNFTKINLAHKVPKVKVNHNHNIPNPIWSEEEIILLLKSIDINTELGKRDYAMIILMAKLGLRFADIKNLKFKDINWTMNMIRIIQSKTKKIVTLPLLNDIGLALIDYIKNGRPNVDSPYIFLNNKNEKFTEKDSFSPMIQKYLKLANVDISNKKYIGTYSLRHSLATTLLQNRVPLSTISGILGHTDMNNTIIYLKVDIPSLRECCLDLEVY